MARISNGAALTGVTTSFSFEEDLEDGPFQCAPRTGGSDRHRLQAAPIGTVNWPATLRVAGQTAGGLL